MVKFGVYNVEGGGHFHTKRLPFCKGGMKVHMHENCIIAHVNNAMV